MKRRYFAESPIEIKSQRTFWVYCGKGPVGTLMPQLLSDEVIQIFNVRDWKIAPRIDLPSKRYFD